MEINAAIAAYLTAKEEQSAAEKRARELKKKTDMLAGDILRHAAGRDAFNTEQWAVDITTTVYVVLDTETLYRDIPDIKDLNQYGKESPRTKITAVPLKAGTM